MIRLNQTPRSATEQFPYPKRSASEHKSVSQNFISAFADVCKYLACAGRSCENSFPTVKFLRTFRRGIFPRPFFDALTLRVCEKIADYDCDFRPSNWNVTWITRCDVASKNLVFSTRKPLGFNKPRRYTRRG